MSDQTDLDLDFEALNQVFFAQCEEGLALLEERLVGLETDPGDVEARDEVFRVVHTIKGDAGSLGFAALAELAHRLEDQLDAVRQGRLRFEPALVSLLLSGVDALRELVAGAAVGTDQLSDSHRDLLRRLDAKRGGEAPAPAAAPNAAPEPSPLSRRVARSLRVDLDRLDQLLTLTGEIAVARGRLTQLVADPSVARGEIAEAHAEADRLYMDLQELVMRLRMVPVGPTFRQLSRTVRDVARAHGREAGLELSGGDVEVDSSVLQLLKDPLSHMIRNAIDHGIEPPDDRERLGKSRRGRIALRASHQSGEIVIELSDDGAGLDLERLLERGRERGLVREGVRPSDPEIRELIFQPGFSTAASVSDLSGRGVGMDVVRRNIDSLRGSVTIDSAVGHGTAFTIRLPLTLSIIDGLLVEVAGEVYVVPLDAVVETLDVPSGRGMAGDRGVTSLREAPLPWLRLRPALGAQGAPPRRENLVVVQAGGRRAGLVVDRLHGQTQTVIKPLSKVFRRLAGIAASAILGDGRVALILDVPALVGQQLPDAGPNDSGPILETDGPSGPGGADRTAPLEGDPSPLERPDEVV